MFREKIKSGVVWVYSGSISMTPAKTQFLQYEPCVLSCFCCFCFLEKNIFASPQLCTKMQVWMYYLDIYFFLVNYFGGIF